MSVSRANWVHPSKQSNAKISKPVVPAGITVGFKQATGQDVERENRDKLQKSLTSAVDRIVADPRLSEDQKLQEINIALNLADPSRGEKPKRGGVLGGFDRFVKKPVVDSSKQWLNLALDVVTPWMNLASSTGVQGLKAAGQLGVAAGLTEGVGKMVRRDEPPRGSRAVWREKVDYKEIERIIQSKPSLRPSWDDWLKNANRKDLYLPFYEEEIFSPLPEWLKFGGTIAQTVATDPITYTGVGATASIGRAARVALSIKMMQKYGSAVDANLIIRYGVAGVPKPIRQLENLDYGLRFAGKVVPQTGKVQDAYTATVGQLRPAIGDVVFSTKSPLRETALMLTPKSQRGLVALGAGRTGAISNAELLPELFKFTASKFAKGAGQAALHGWQKELVEIGQRRQGMLRPFDGEVVNPLYDPQAANMYRYLEMPDSELALQPISDGLKDLVRDAKGWQDNIRNQVNDQLLRLGADFNLNVSEIGFVDDFLHHKITPEARRWLATTEGRKSFSNGFWKPDEMTAMDLTDQSGPLMYRRLRGGSRIDPDTGEEIFETFFGVPVRDGTIDEINKIFGDFLEANGQKRMNWFETDVVSVMDSYAFSMSRSVARNAFIRRAFDFGEDVVRPLIKTVVPDAELVEALTKVHNGLLRQQNFIRTRIATNSLRASDYAKQGLQYATRFLNGETRRRAGMTKEITRLNRELDGMLADLSAANQRAAQKGAAARGDFDVVNRSLLEEIAKLKQALDDPERYAATIELRRIYASMYPNHNPDALVGKTPEWLAEKISSGNGVPAARELRAINKQVKDMRAIIDSLPDEPAFTELRRQLEDYLADKSAVEQGFTNLAGVRSKADYSEGFLYGYLDDLPPMPEQEGAKIFRTSPMDEAFDSSPNAVALKAVDADQLTDLRNPEVFEFFWQEWEQFPEALADSLRFHGLDEIAEVFEEQFKLAWDTGMFDPLAVQMYPEVTSLIEEIWKKSSVNLENAVGEEQIYEIFTTVRDRLMRTLDLDNPDGLDELMADVLDRAYHEYTIKASRADGRPQRPNLNTASGEQSVGFILPQSFVDDMLLEELPNQWAVVMPHDTALPRTPSKSSLGEVLSVSDNELVQSVRKGVYEPASLEATSARTAAEQALTDLELGGISRGEAQKSIRELNARKGGLQASVNATKRRAEKAKEVLQRTGSVEIEIGGVKQTVTRQQAQDQLVRLEGDLGRKLDRLSRQVDAIYAAEGVPRVGSKGSGVINKLNSYKERLPMLLNQAKVLKQWNNDVGIVLARDIQDLRTLVTSRPPRGAAAGESAAWVRKVDRTLDSIDDILDPVVRQGYERVTTLLHADEAQLALLESVTIPKIENQLTLMRKGYVGNMVETTLEGWEALAGTGAQMPRELVEMWKPNVEKLLTKAGRNKFLKAYDYSVRFFKTYATASVGFFTRNGISATFMNWVADVTSENMVDGFRAAMAIGKGPKAWDDFLAKLPFAERKIFQTAWEATEATGRGQSDELAALTLRGGAGEKAVNNAYTRFFRKKNEFVERAVRMPMALDSLRRGQNFDQAVARVARYHFDYSDLSQFDETMRQLIPFWIWSSRNVPLQVVEQMVHPRAYAIYEKIKNASPVGDDIMMPEWIAEWEPIGVGGVNSEGGQWVSTPDLPFVRMEQQFEQLTDPKRLLGQVAPIVKVPLELIGGKQLGIDVGPFRDRPQPASGFDKAVLVPLARVLAGDGFLGVDSVTGEVLLDERFPYVATNAFPLLGQLYRTTGGAFGGRQSRSLDERKLGNILNWFGLPFRYVGPSQQEAEAYGRIMDISEWMSKNVSSGKFTKKKDLPKP